MRSDVVDNNIGEELFYARYNVNEFLSTLFGCNPSYASQLIVQVLFHHRRSGHEDGYLGKRAGSQGITGCLEA